MPDEILYTENTCFKFDTTIILINIWLKLSFKKHFLFHLFIYSFIHRLSNAD